MAKQNKVAVNLAQDFTDTEKAQARANIGAGTSNTTIVHDSNTLPPVITNVNQMTIFNDGRTKFDTNYNGVIPTEPGQSDAGSVLVANYAGSPAKGTAVWNNIHTVGIREVPGATATDAGKVLTVNSDGNADWQTPTSGSGITMAAFRTIKTISIPGGNSSMLTDLYKIYDLAPKTAVNMTVFVCDMDRNGLQMMGISLWCGSTNISANSFTRGSYTSISHAIPVCYYNNSNSPIEIKIGFNGTFAQEDVYIEMMGFTISQGT